MTVHSQFPDPEGQPKLLNIEQAINRTIIQIDDDNWFTIDEYVYCKICGPFPGGYRLRRNASIDSHANQRDPNTHRRNVVWMACLLLKQKYGSIPRWPDCYRPTRDGQLWCHICRMTCGLYDRETAELHDSYHANLKQIVMRPERVGQGSGRQAHKGRTEGVLDAAISVYQGTYQEPESPSPGIKRHVDQGATKPWQRVDDDNPMRTYLYEVTSKETRRPMSLRIDELERIVEEDNGLGGVMRMTIACVSYDCCVNLHVPGTHYICKGGGGQCECSCHRDNG